MPSATSKTAAGKQKIKKRGAYIGFQTDRSSVRDTGRNSHRIRTESDQVSMFQRSLRNLPTQALAAMQKAATAIASFTPLPSMKRKTSYRSRQCTGGAHPSCPRSRNNTNHK